MLDVERDPTHDPTRPYSLNRHENPRPSRTLPRPREFAVNRPAR